MYCIYKITNLINNKTYVGQHKYKKLNDNYFGSGVLIKQAIKKYGKENFTKEILEANIETVELANDFEQMYILFERAKGKAEYNVASGGFGTKGCAPWNKGKQNVYSEEQLKRLSESHKGYKHTSEQKRKISEANKGRNFSDESKRKMSESRKGIIFSEETKKKLSEAKKGSIPWNKGKKGLVCWAEDSKQKQSKILSRVQKEKSAAYKEYKRNGGLLNWNDFQKLYKERVISNGA